MTIDNYWIWCSFYKTGRLISGMAKEVPVVEFFHCLLFLKNFDFFNAFINLIFLGQNFSPSFDGLLVEILAWNFARAVERRESREFLPGPRRVRLTLFWVIICCFGTKKEWNFLKFWALCLEMKVGPGEGKKVECPNFFTGPVHSLYRKLKSEN